MSESKAYISMPRHNGEIVAKPMVGEFEQMSAMMYDLRKSRWRKLFGTPERAAEYFAMQCFGSDGSLCNYCPFDDCDESLRNMGTHSTVYDALLEWLRGDA